MEKKSHTDDHDLPPSDEATRNKIDKHLSEKEDTISEEDMKKINTITGKENSSAASHKDADEENKIDKENDESDNDDDEPKKEMPNTWDILNE